MFFLCGKYLCLSVKGTFNSIDVYFCKKVFIAMLSTLKNRKYCKNIDEKEQNSVRCDTKELNLGITLKGGQSFR
jgi:hypothetical protein